MHVNASTKERLIHIFYYIIFKLTPKFLFNSKVLGIFGIYLYYLLFNRKLLFCYLLTFS